MSLLLLNDNRDIFIVDARAVLMHLSTFQGYLYFPQQNVPRSKPGITEPSVRCLNTRVAGRIGSTPRTGNIGTSTFCCSRCPSGDVAANGL